MGTFFHPITITGPSGQSETLEALVDTGASFTTIPRPVLERLGFSPHRTTRLRIATGEAVEWPWGWVDMTLDGVQEQTPCVFAPEGAPPVIGAITLEIMGLGVDPRGKRLVPREGFAMTTAAPDFDQVREYLKGERWIGEVPGIGRLRSYLAKIGAEGDPNHPFWRLVRRPEDMIEFASAANLIWYLNSGGHRNYVIASRPDEDDRTTANPDFLLEDEQSGQHQVALEVTSAFRPEDVSGSTPLRRHLVEVLRMMLNVSRGCERGLFSVYVGDVAIRRRGLDWLDAATAMAKRIAETARSLADGEATIREPFEATLIKTSNAGGPYFSVHLREERDRESVLAYFADEVDHGDAQVSIEDSFERWQTDWQIEEGIRSCIVQALGEADAKLAGFQPQDTILALLVTLRYELLEFLEEDYLHVARLRELPSESWPNVDRFYIHHRGLDLMPWTVSRVW